MPYETNADLPDTVKRHLPDHAQDIYRAAFNNAYADHAGEAGRDVHRQCPHRHGLGRCLLRPDALGLARNLDW
jgi:hypothetical protein